MLFSGREIRVMLFSINQVARQHLKMKNSFFSFNLQSVFFFPPKEYEFIRVGRSIRLTDTVLLRTGHLSATPFLGHFTRGGYALLQVKIGS